MLDQAVLFFHLQADRFHLFPGLAMAVHPKLLLLFFRRGCSIHCRTLCTSFRVRTKCRSNTVMGLFVRCLSLRILNRLRPSTMVAMKRLRHPSLCRFHQTCNLEDLLCRLGHLRILRLGILLPCGPKSPALQWSSMLLFLRLLVIYLMVLCLLFPALLEHTGILLLLYLLSNQVRMLLLLLFLGSRPVLLVFYLHRTTCQGIHLQIQVFL